MRTQGPRIYKQPGTGTKYSVFFVLGVSGLGLFGFR